MYPILLIVGIMAALAGVAVTGFGITIKEFSLGNALLIAGSTVLMGGLIVIGIAAAVRELRRIADALTLRPAARIPFPGEPVQPPAPGTIRPTAGPGRMPPPPRGPRESPEREPRPNEPRLAAIPPVPPAVSSVPPVPPLELPSEKFLRSFERPTAASMPGAEPPMVDEHEEIPLSPQPPLRAPSLFDDEARLDAAPAEPPTEPASATEPAAEPERTTAEVPLTPPSESVGTTRQRTVFDTIWPVSDRAARKFAPVEEAPESLAPMRLGVEEETSGEAESADATAGSDAVAVTVERPVEETSSHGTHPPAEETARARDEPRPAILKSGVVDGMAYTLYADGSIEAELPDGTLRFASINELRLHLESRTNDA